MQRIYLDELEETVTNSLGIRVVKLIIEPENEAVNLAKSLVSQTKEEITDSKIQQNLIDLITKIIVDKLPQKSREEIQAMLGLSDLKRTKFYQEAFAEGKEESNSKSVSNMISLGLNLETIAKYLDLSLDEVQRLAKQNQKRD